jgi:hypothetical protein
MAIKTVTEYLEIVKDSREVLNILSQFFFDMAFTWIHKKHEAHPYSAIPSASIRMQYVREHPNH